MLRENINVLSGKIIHVAYEIHSGLGPGLLESVYEVIKTDKLKREGLFVERQVPVPIIFEGISLEVGFRADLIIEHRVIVELKSVEKLEPVHSKQLLTYMKLLDYRLGLLINFGAPFIKDGIRRIVNGL